MTELRTVEKGCMRAMLKLMLYFTAVWGIMYGGFIAWCHWRDRDSKKGEF